MRIAVWFILTAISPITIWAASHHPQEFLDGVRGKPDEGAQIVGHFCAVCHAKKPQIPLGAPRQGVESDWKSRWEQGLKAMLENTAEGINAMPPRGGCFECTDLQLKKAIAALLPEKFRARIAKDVKGE